MNDKLLEILAETLETDVSQLHPDTDFRAHARWDSLAALTLVTAVEDDFGVMLTDRDLRDADSIAALAQRIQAKK